MSLRTNHVWKGGPFIDISAAIDIRTQTLDYALKGAPFATNDDPVPESPNPRNDCCPDVNEVPVELPPNEQTPPEPLPTGSTYPPITASYETPGVAGSYFRTVPGSKLATMVFPGTGGIGTFTWRYYIRRSASPVMATGTVAQITRGDSHLTVDIDAGEILTLRITDGTDTVVLTAVAIPSWDWTSVTIMHHVTGVTRVYVDDVMAVEGDTSSLTVTALPTDYLIGTFGSKSDQSDPIDIGFIGIAGLDELLYENEVESLNSAGVYFDLGNATGWWTGSKRADVFWRDAIVDGIVPGSGCSCYIEPLIVVGDALTEPIAPDDVAGPNYGFGFNFGHPSMTDDEVIIDYYNMAFGDPSGAGRSNLKANPPTSPRFLISLGRTHEYADDGSNNLVELYAPGATLPGRGPYRVRLIDAAGNLWPPTSEVGCYAAVASRQDSILSSRSLEYIRFALPIVPQGAYGLQIEWGEVNRLTLDELILVVPADTSLESIFLDGVFG